MMYSYVCERSEKHIDLQRLPRVSSFPKLLLQSLQPAGLRGKWSFPSRWQFLPIYSMPVFLFFLPNVCLPDPLRSTQTRSSQLCLLGKAFTWYHESSRSKLYRSLKFVVLGSATPPLLLTLGMYLRWVFSFGSPCEGAAQLGPLEAVDSKPTSRTDHAAEGGAVAVAMSCSHSERCELLQPYLWSTSWPKAGHQSVQGLQQGLMSMI